MGRTLALIVLASVSVAIAQAHEKPTPQPKLSTVTPQHDWRLAKANGVQPQKIGVLTYYPNAGGGYTFIQGEYIVFYALPYAPTTSQDEFIVLLVNGKNPSGQLWESRRLSTIGTSKLSFGGQTVYRCEMKATHQRVPLREDIAIAKWTRDTPDGKFRLSIMAEDNETRLKLKSIVPVLEHAR